MFHGLEGLRPHQAIPLSDKCRDAGDAISTRLHPVLVDLRLEATGFDDRGRVRSGQAGLFDDVDQNLWVT